MAMTRIELQKILEALLGSKNVYYQPPSNHRIKYPAIIYSKIEIRETYADNSVYLRNPSYEIIYVDSNPDSPVIDKILNLPYCRFSRHYKSDNMNHDVFNVYV